MITVRWFLLGLFGAAIAVALFLQRETTANLRDEIALLRDEQRELVVLRAERERLRAAQPSAAELDRLRADRAALMQLRSEIDAMSTRADHLSRNQTTAKAADGPVPPAHVVKIAFEADGKPAIDGTPLNINDLDGLWARVASLGKDGPIDVIIVPNSKARPEDVTATANRLLAASRELGVKLNVRFERPTFTINTTVP